MINIELPPLRERLADIRPLAERFLGLACARLGRQVSGISPAALAAMQRYSWPGNVRELENMVQRAVLLAKGALIEPHDLPPMLASDAHSQPVGGTLKEALEAPERQIILSCLEENGWNRHRTADQLGINRTTLYKKMKRLGLESGQLL